MVLLRKEIKQVFPSHLENCFFFFFFFFIEGLTHSFEVSSSDEKH